MIKTFWIVLALQPSEFPSIQINNFMSFCGTNVRMELLMRGMSDMQATTMAVVQCSCVLDKVRSDYSFQEFLSLGSEGQKSVSMGYAYECANVKKPEETVEPI